MVMHKFSATPREAGVVQAMLLMLAALLPIMGTLTMLPVMPILFGHFAAQPHAQLLVPMIITLPAVSMALRAAGRNGGRSPESSPSADRRHRRVRGVWPATGDARRSAYHSAGAAGDGHRRRFYPPPPPMR